MSTWLDHWDRRYTDRVRLLVDILPVLAQEPRFALKGGTAINLFEHDLPRLSAMPASWRRRCRGNTRAISSTLACCWRTSGRTKRSGAPSSCT